MTLDERAQDVRVEVRRQVATIERPEPDAIARRSRRGRIATAAVVLAVLALTGAALMLALQDDPAPTGPQVTHDPQITDDPEMTATGPDVPVWWDAAGLHHGDVVEQTPFELNQRDEVVSVLALVRAGALYLERETGAVWFHPWGGEPRIVGHNSDTGPGGDSQGVVAAWFEGTELVVYDTARGVEISRTPEEPALAAPFRRYVNGYEHVGGNGFMHVSSEEVVWRSAVGVHRLDVASGRSALMWEGSQFAEVRLEDRQDGTRVWGDYGTGSLSVEDDERGRRPVPGLEPMGRLSSDGRFVVSAWEADGAVGAGFVDLDTGETWPVVGDDWNAWIAWSYGDLAVIRVERGTVGPDLGLFACEPDVRRCTRLEARGPFVLPSS